MKTAIFLQARLNSKRLPKKILMTIKNKTIIEIILNRLEDKKKKIDLFVLTSVSKTDKFLIKFLKIRNIKYFAGSENNVLSRFYHAAKKKNISTIIRCNGDCPFVDIKLVRKMLKIFKKKKVDYISNILVPCFPSGMHIEIFNFKSLETAFLNAKNKLDREHVTPFIYNNQKKFKILKYYIKNDYSEHRWTLDYKEDYLFIKKIISILGLKNLTMYKILNLIRKNPKLKKINYHIPKKQNLLKK